MTAEARLVKFQQTFPRDAHVPARFLALFLWRIDLFGLKVAALDEGVHRVARHGEKLGYFATLTRAGTGVLVNG